MRQAVYELLAARAGAREGRLWPAAKIRTAFESAVERAGLEDFVFHDCRHHFASWFVMRGGGLPALQQLLGHEDDDDLRPPEPGAPAGRGRQDGASGGDPVADRPHRSAHGQHKAHPMRYSRRNAWVEVVDFMWCRRGDSNPHTLAGT
jgi:hypothetical protein